MYNVFAQARLFLGLVFNNVLSERQKACANLSGPALECKGM